MQEPELKNIFDQLEGTHWPTESAYTNNRQRQVPISARRLPCNSDPVNIQYAFFKILLDMPSFVAFSMGVSPHAPFAGEPCAGLQNF